MEVTKTLLFSRKRLDRDAGESNLNNMTKSETHDIFVAFVNELLAELQARDEHTSWSTQHGCLLGVKCILSKYTQADSAGFHDVLEPVRLQAVESLSHDEVRVRLMAVKLMGVLCMLTDGRFFIVTKPKLLDLLTKDLERHGQEDVEENKSMNSYSSAAEMLHQSAGWRHLETSMKCLQEMMVNSGQNFRDQVDEAMMSLLFKALVHENRFVRETAFGVCAELFVDKSRIDANPALFAITDKIAENIAVGLADNWSQVRLASSKVARNFLVNFEDAEKHFDKLLPRLCLNRYYIADGVRIYCQKSWQEITGGRGIELVEKYIGEVVAYYVTATQANNHAVREAGCHCIAELALKVNPDRTRPYVSDLVKALLDCFKDDSWPVRDAACISCGNLLLQFHNDVRDHQEELFKLFLGNLEDPIASVRAGAAISLGKYARSYGDEVLPVLEKYIRDGFAHVKNQPADAENFTGLDKKPAVFGVVKNLHDPNHTNQVMYSCGSLAPKMGGRKKGGGCMDCHFQRPSKPWERSDGCVYFLVELAQYHPATALALIPDMIKASGHKHYPQHVVFIETICKQLPTLAKFVKKRPFKAHLEGLLDIIFYAVDSETQLTQASGETCMHELSSFLGTNILRGRIEMHRSERVHFYDKLVMTAMSTVDPTSVIPKPY